MARPLPLKKSLSGLLTFLVVLGMVGPGGFAIQVPTTYAASYIVSNINDAGAGSLRQAITDANANPGADIITFSTTGTVNLASDLPAITEQVTIDGSSQNPSFVLNAGGRTYGLAVTNGAGTQIYGISIQGATDCIKIQGNGVSNTAIGNSVSQGAVLLNGCSGSGINIDQASTTTIKNSFIGAGSANGTGITIQNNANGVTLGGLVAGERNIIQSSTTNGIFITGSSNITIKNNYIGLDKNGNDAGNGQNGIFVNTGVTSLVIGGNTSAERNVISGNGIYGINISSDSVTVLGNYIGTDPTGTAARANDGGGIKLESSSNTIGGSTSADGNLISGNGNTGIRLDANVRDVNNNVIRKNMIGVTAAGNVALPNSSFGVTLSGLGVGRSMNNNMIGDNNGGNVISGNNGGGIFHQNATSTNIAGNYIGLAADGYTPMANTGPGINVNSGSVAVGGVSCSACINIIDANGGPGIILNSNNNTIYNNWFGLNKDGQYVGNLVNSGHGVRIDGTASSNQIGAAVDGGANTFNVNMTKVAVRVDGGNNNNTRKNIYWAQVVGGVYTSNNGGTNENMQPPIYVPLRTGPNTVQVTGTAAANSTVDIYIDANPVATVTADGAGNFSANITNTGGTLMSTFATTAGGSTSGSQTVASIPSDSTAPSAPVMNQSTIDVTYPNTVTLSGTGEIGASVYSNGVDTTVDVDGAGNFSFSPSLVLGTNTFNVTLVDWNSNTSSAAVVTVNNNASGGSGTAFVGGGGSSSNNGDDDDDDDDNGENSVDPNSQETLETGTTEEEEASIAGDTEVVEVETSTDTTNSNNGANNQNSGSSNQETTVPEVKEPVKTPTKSFYTKAEEIIKPIRIQTIRDTFPADPVKPMKFKPDVFKGDIFGANDNKYKLPEKFIEIKLGDKDADLDQDTDGDGLLNGEELLYGGNPNAVDSDGDGVKDGEEVYLNGTDPEDYDSDGDGVADTKDSEPLVYSNPEENVTEGEVSNYILEEEIDTPVGVTDSDKDGLADLYELWLGTDPQDDDSDADGLSDGDEVQHSGTDPLTSTTAEQAGILRVVNVKDEETVAEGAQFYMGQSSEADQTVGIYEVNSDGSFSLLGETTSDENGRWSLMTSEELTPGTHTLLAIEGTLEEPKDISKTFTVNVLDFVKRPEYVSLGLKNGATIVDRQPVIDLLADDHYMVVVSWKSTIYSQTLIADSADQIVYAQPAENLELGDHTVSWYAVDTEDNQKSAPTQVAFTIANTAFMDGQNSNNTLAIILGSIAVLASLTALGLYFRKNGPKKS